MFEDSSRGLALTVNEFCSLHKICRATFYKLLKTNEGPKVMRFRGSIRISQEAAREWRQKREERF